MGGYVLNSRDVTRHVFTRIGYPFGDDFRVDVRDFMPTATQHTASYRSNVLADDQTIADANKIFVNGFKTNFETLNKNPKDSLSDTGHEFYSIKQFATLSHPDSLCTVAYDGGPYIKGGLIPYDSAGAVPYGFPVVNRLSDTEIAYYGHKAIANTIPTKPGASLTDFLAQSVLTPRPKMILDIPNILTRTQAFKELGSQYLNLKFGWVPMVSDFRDLMNVVLNSYKEIKKYENGSGKTTRRSYTFQPETSNGLEFISSNGTLSTTVNNPAIFGNKTYGTITGVTSSRRNIWFRGAYTYYLSAGPNVLDRMEKYAFLAHHLLGLNLTPAVLWDLAPWTWLIDWKLDLTSVFDVQSALQTDNAVIRYAYLMCETRTDNTLTLSGLDPVRGTRGPYQIVFSVVQKERVAATPYGFGVNPESFSPEQLAILFALGISRGRGARPFR